MKTTHGSSLSSCVKDVLAAQVLIGGFVYTGVIFAAFLDWLRLGLTPSPYFFAGALLVMAAGALMFRLASRGPIVIDSE